MGNKKTSKDFSLENEKQIKTGKDIQDEIQLEDLDKIAGGRTQGGLQIPRLWHH